jgi:hypothetical protein
MRYSKEIAQGGEYDVVVCGGGFSGFAAAYSAAREGLSVLLVERGGTLGGTGTQGMVNHILGVRTFEDGVLKQCVNGVFDELERRLLALGAGVDVRDVDPDLNPHGWKRGLATGLVFDGEAMKLLLEQMLAEVGAGVLYYTDILDVCRQGAHITGVVVHNKSGLSVIGGKCFVDATGDGDIAAFCGCAYECGDEEGGLAAASLEMHVENVATKALTAYMRDTGDDRFRAIIGRLKEEGKWPFPYEIFISVKMLRDDVYMINTIRQVGVDGTDAASVSDAVLRGRAENFRLLSLMRAHFPGFSGATVRAIAPVIGIRETRRLRTRYTLRVQDVIDGTSFADGIALSGYGWDMPHPKDPSRQPYHGVARKSKFTQIPYGCLLPVGVPNLIAVGRCIGVEREALGVVRVMGPCLAMGECAGIAASLALAQEGCFDLVNTDALRCAIRGHGGMVDREDHRVIR